MRKTLDIVGFLRQIFLQEGSLIETHEVLRHYAVLFFFFFKIIRVMLH